MPFIPNLISLAPDSPIELFEISEFNLTNLSETLYICNYANVSFNGITYNPVGIEAEGFDVIGQGTLPTPSLVVSNIGMIVSDWIKQCKLSSNYRLEGSLVKRRITQRQFLDDGTNSNASIKEYPKQEFIIEQKEEENYTSVKFRLCSPFDIEGVTLPGRVLVRSCTWRYRSPECGYLGSYYTIQNLPTTNPKLDKCAKTLTACETRFGELVDLPFGGAPGLNTYSV